MGQAGHDDNELIAIACITRPQGLRGFCHVVVIGSSFFGQLPDTLFVGITPQSVKPMRVTDVKQAGGGVIAKLDGVDSCESAEAFRSQYIYARLGDLPALNNDEYYHFELVGMSVVYGTEVLGVVECVEEYPTTDAIEIRKSDGHTVVVPFNRQTVTSVDRVKRIVSIDREAVDELL